MPLPPLPANPAARKKMLKALLALKRMNPQTRAKALEKLRAPKAGK